MDNCMSAVWHNSVLLCRIDFLLCLDASVPCAWRIHAWQCIACDVWGRCTMKNPHVQAKV